MTPETPSNSSSAKPRPSQPPSKQEGLLKERDNLLAVLALFRQVDLWEALHRVLEVERQGHSLASVYSSDNDERQRHNGVVMWISEVLAGALDANYAGQARDRLGMTPKDNTLDLPDDGGTPYMSLDSFDNEGDTL